MLTLNNRTAARLGSALAPRIVERLAAPAAPGRRAAPE